MKFKHKFFLGLLLIVIGIVTNSVYWYYNSQGYSFTGFLGIFLMVSASIPLLFVYFGVGGWLVYKNYWIYWMVDEL